MDAVSRLLADLVAIPSVNPMGRPLTGPGYLEAGMTDYLDRWFRDLGVPFERQSIAPGRENLLARLRIAGARADHLFDAHQDTVPTDGMTIDPCRPHLDAGRMYGRGACDIKGGMAAMLTAFARLVRERPSGAASVVMACTVDEEYTHQGSSRLGATPHGAALAFVSEPTRLQIVNCHKGAIRWKVRTHGVACHSSTPHLGSTRSTGWPGSSRPWRARRRARHLDPTRVLGPPSLVGRPDRRGLEPQYRPRLVRDRDRPAYDTR